MLVYACSDLDIVGDRLTHADLSTTNIARSAADVPFNGAEQKRRDAGPSPRSRLPANQATAAYGMLHSMFAALARLELSI
jgi:hypothetical protein